MPQPLNKDVVVAALPSRPTDPDLLSLQAAYKDGGGELTALIGLEDLSLQLGMDVIANDFGGNTDFCTGTLAHPVRYRKDLIPRGRYPFADGHHWAEPDLDHAAELCKEMASRRSAITDNRVAFEIRQTTFILS